MNNLFRDITYLNFVDALRRSKTYDSQILCELRLAIAMSNTPQELIKNSSRVRNIYGADNVDRVVRRELERNVSL